MGLIEKYLQQTSDLLKEFSRVRKDNLFLFTQEGTNISSIYWRREVSNFPYKVGEPRFPYRYVNGEKLDKPVYPTGIIQVRLNSEAMEFLKRKTGPIDWNEFKPLNGWYYY